MTGVREVQVQSREVTNAMFYGYFEHKSCEDFAHTFIGKNCIAGKQHFVLGSYWIFQIGTTHRQEIA